MSNFVAKSEILLRYCLFFLDGNIFQEKVQSIMYLRNSSSGGKSVDSPALAVTCPTGFSAACQDGKSCLCILSDKVIANGSK